MFDRVLNIPGFYICPWFWLCEGYEYVGVTQDSEYAWLISKPAWMAFILIPHLIPCLFEYVVTCFNVYTRLEVLV